MSSEAGQPRSIGGADLAETSAMRHGSAHGIDRGVADDQIEIGAVRSERIVAWRADLGTRLPPAMLAANDPWIETLVQADAGPCCSLRRFDRGPIASAEPARGGRRGMQLDFGVTSASAQARQTAMLALTELRRFGARQDQRIERGQPWTRARAHER